VSAGGRYTGGLLVVAIIGLATVFTVSPAIRREVAWGIGIALLVQAPLGWWTVASIGTDRFQLVWVLGMVIRLALVAVAGLYLVPALRWELVATLAALVATMLVLLVVEVVAVLGNNPRSRHDDS
jgi:heme A synthase